MAIKYPRSPQQIPNPSPNAIADVSASEEATPFGSEATVSEGIETPFGSEEVSVTEESIDPVEIDAAKAVAKFIKEEISQRKDEITQRISNADDPYIETGLVVAPITKEEVDAIKGSEIPHNSEAIPALLAVGNEAVFGISKLTPSDQQKGVSLMAALDAYSNLGDPDFGKSQQVSMAKRMLESMKANEQNAAALRDAPVQQPPLGVMQPPTSPAGPLQSPQQSTQQPSRGLLGGEIPPQDIA